MENNVPSFGMWIYHTTSHIYRNLVKDIIKTKLKIWESNTVDNTYSKITILPRNDIG